MKNGGNHVAQRLSDRVELGQYIVADPAICHGKPTFKGTRIMVWQVLDDVAEGRSWDFICTTRWGGRISLAAVAEAVKLSRESAPLLATTAIQAEILHHTNSGTFIRL